MSTDELDKKDSATQTFTIESHYAKQSDGFVYYYWRIVGLDREWNVQKTAMKEVPAVELVQDIHKKVASGSAGLIEGKNDD